MKEFILSLYISLLSLFGVATRVEPPPLSAPTVRAVEVQPVVVPVVAFSDSRVIQGEPLALRVCPEDPEKFIVDITTITIASTSLPFGIVKNCITALYGVDIQAPTGPLVGAVRLVDGNVLYATTTVLTRPRVEAPLSIPEKLGGNTPAAATKVVNTLALENKKLASLKKPDNTPKTWTHSFTRPVEGALVTDTYGYVRDTVGQTITHKGTDYRAAIGDAVVAPQDGSVAESAEYSVYGKTIVIDHGLGVQTMLMHLSESFVKAGQTVSRGELIGKAGSTGYALSPHLHLSIRIGGISIDPEKFFSLFGILPAPIVL